MKDYLGKIDFEMQGRFAPRYPGGLIHYVPDVQMMVLNPTDSLLYFASPDLTIQSVRTDILDTVPVDVVSYPDSGLSNKILNGYVKLEYDDDNSRLYWLTIHQSANFQSYDSYFTVYKPKQTGGGFDNIYHEYQNGSDTTTGGYIDLMQTFEINPTNDDFYVTRKKQIEIMEVVGSSVSVKKNIPIASARIDRLLLVDNGNIKKLLAFPCKLPYSFPGDPVYERIYQVDLSNTSFAVDSSQISPSKKVIDAVYLASKNQVAICFVNDNMNGQIANTSADVAIYYYDATDSLFKSSAVIHTHTASETDTVTINFNRPMNLYAKSNGDLIFSKKNEVCSIVSQPTGGYTVSSIYYARDNHFYKTIKVGAYYFVMNTVNMGVERFYSSMNRDLAPIRIGFPAYQIVANPNNRKLYLFNRLSSGNGGYYVYNLESESIEAFIETPNPIGDLIYNPLTNQVVLAEFAANTQGNEGLRVYNGSTNAFEQTYTYPGKGYLGRLFLAPNNKLYISANTKCDNIAAKVLICDASDYSLIDSVSVGITENVGVAFCLRTYYCYNPYNGLVYSVFNNNVSYQTPYQTAYHSTFRITDPLENPNPPQTNSKFFAINEDNNMVSIPVQLDNPGEVLCAVPATVKEKANYKGIIYIAGTHLYVYNVFSDSLAFVSISKTVDMEYSPRTNCLYVYEHEISGANDQLDTNYVNIYKVKEDASTTLLWQETGFANSLTYNKYDGQLYLYYDADMQMLGFNPSKVYRINADADSNAAHTSVNLPLKSVLPQFFPQVNTPYFDPYGKAYFPNGMHSSVSVVNSTGGNEALHLTPGPNWISIPRLEANDGTNFMQADTIPDVFNRNSFAIPYSNLELEHNRVWSSSSEQDYLADWKEGEWNFVPDDPDNQNTYSYRGYTLLLDEKDSSHNTLYMQGQIKNPATTFPLYKDKKNWIGYFLVNEQDVFDALSDHLDSLTEIWHRNYYCYRNNGGEIIFGPEGGGAIGPHENPVWACTNSSHTIRYGEMIKLHPKGDLMGENAFYWSTGNSEAPRKSRPGVTYYSFTETASYKPIVIELDTTENPEEIGAFVNDTCVGACSVIEADTAVILMAYLEGRPADSIEFREYSSAKSSGMNSITSYLVFNKKRGQFEKRGISIREGNDRVLVSFKKQKVMKPEKHGLNFRLWPNPATDRLFYSFTLREETFVRIALFDITGKLMMEELQNAMQAGSTRGELLLKSFSGEKLKPGIYLVKIKAGEILETKKVIVK